jgi:hypothetical protein
MTLTLVDRHALDRLHAEHHFTLLIAGRARGADTLASEWATARGVPTEVLKKLDRSGTDDARWRSPI